MSICWLSQNLLYTPSNKDLLQWTVAAVYSAYFVTTLQFSRNTVAAIVDIANGICNAADQ